MQTNCDDLFERHTGRGRFDPIKFHSKLQYISIRELYNIPFILKPVPITSCFGSATTPFFFIYRNFFLPFFRGIVYSIFMELKCCFLLFCLYFYSIYCMCFEIGTKVGKVQVYIKDWDKTFVEFLYIFNLLKLSMFI